LCVFFPRGPRSVGRSVNNGVLCNFSFLFFPSFLFPGREDGVLKKEEEPVFDRKGRRSFACFEFFYTPLLTALRYVTGRERWEMGAGRDKEKKKKKGGSRYKALPSLPPFSKDCMKLGGLRKRREERGDRGKEVRGKAGKGKRGKGRTEFLCSLFLGYLVPGGSCQQ